MLVPGKVGRIREEDSVRQAHLMSENAMTITHAHAPSGDTHHELVNDALEASWVPKHDKARQLHMQIARETEHPKVAAANLVAASNHLDLAKLPHDEAYLAHMELGNRLSNHETTAHMAEHHLERAAHHLRESGHEQEFYPEYKSEPGANALADRDRTRRASDTARGFTVRKGHKNLSHTLLVGKANDATYREQYGVAHALHLQIARESEVQDIQRPNLIAASYNLDMLPKTDHENLYGHHMELAHRHGMLGEHHKIHADLAEHHLERAAHHLRESGYQQEFYPEYKSEMTAKEASMSAIEADPHSMIQYEDDHARMGWHHTMRALHFSPSHGRYRAHTKAASLHFAEVPGAKGDALRASHTAYKEKQVGFAKEALAAAVQGNHKQAMEMHQEAAANTKGGPKSLHVHAAFAHMTAMHADDEEMPLYPEFRAIIDGAQFGYCPECKEPGVSAIHCPNGHTYNKAKYSYVGIDLDGVAAENVREFPIDAEDLGEKGRVDRPHITARYGLHTLVPPKELSNFGLVKYRLHDLGVFENPGEDVLYVKVDSPDLHRMHEKLGAVFHTDTQSTYIPHATIAYLKPGTGKKYTGHIYSAGETSTATFSTPKGDKTEIDLESQVKARRDHTPWHPTPSDAFLLSQQAHGVSVHEQGEALEHSRNAIEAAQAKDAALASMHHLTAAKLSEGRERRLHKRAARAHFNTAIRRLS